MMKRNLFLWKSLTYFILLLSLSGRLSAQINWFDIAPTNGVYSFSYNQTPDALLPLNQAVTGVTYQWYSCANPIGTFLPISGATQSSLTFTAPLTQTTFFYRVTRLSPFLFFRSNMVRLELVSVNWENYNYIREHEVLVPGKTDWKTVDQLPIGQKLQTTTYMDGIGRMVETISKQTATPDPAQGGTLWGDVVKFNRYDAYGRQDKKDLVYTTTSAGELGKFKSAPITEQTQYYTNLYSETSPYKATSYENNPLSRVTQVKVAGSVGAASQGESFTYDLNTLDENVQNFTIGYNTGDMPVSRGAYPASSLFKNVSVDEKNQKVIEYTDNEGQLILRKVQVDATPGAAHSGWACTYTVYDEFGLVRYTISPEAVKWLDANSWAFSGTDGQTVLKEMCARYEYDDNGRVILKKSAGAKEVYMVYDARDRVVFSQDANQRAKSPGEWLTTLYDDLDRVVLTTLYETTETAANLQTDINNATTTTYVDIPGTDGPYQANLVINSRNTGIFTYIASNSISFTTGFSTVAGDHFEAYISPQAPSGMKLAFVTYGNPIPAAAMSDPTKVIPLRYNYYDDYTYAGAKSFDNGYNNGLAYSTSDPTVLPIASDNRTLNLLTGTKTRILGTTTFLMSSIYYDSKSRIIQSLDDNIKSGVDITTNQYHFDERLLSIDERHTAANTAFTNFDILTKNIFDQIGRVTSIQKKYGSNAFKTVATYDLDDIGRTKTRHFDPGYTGTGGTELESLSYSYSIQGMITGVNKDYALKTPGKYNKWGHFFGQYFGYDNKDGVFTDWQLDGHITGTIWSTQGDDVQRRFDYSYDPAGRLTKALYGEKQNTGDSYSSAKMDFSTTGYNGKIEYDLNGNLLALLQKGIIPGNQTPVNIDDLRYTYARLSNKLAKVTDNSNAGAANGKLGDFADGANGTADDYVYDDNGNLVIDLNKNAKDLNGVVGANGVSYNYLDKPEQIRVAGKGLIKIVYGADGNKLQKIYTPEGSSTSTTTSYINGYVYIGDNLQYIDFEEGRIRVMHTVAQNNGYDLLDLDGNFDLPGSQRGAYDYFVRDFQGNVRMILTEETHLGSNSCTMETARAANEEPVFGKVDATGTPTADNEVKQRFAVSSIPGQGSGGGWQNAAIGNYVIRLGNLVGKKVGPNALMKVMAGDQISAQSIYYYQNAVVNTTGGTSLVTDVITSLATAISTSNITTTLMHGSASNIVSPLSASAPFSAAANPDASNASGTNPKAYMTVLFFDERFNFVGEGSASTRVIQSGNGASPLTLTNIKAPKNGYAFVYVGNESDETVYFDNFKVTNNHGAILEENHYYAYGLKIASISSKVLADPNEGFTTNKNLLNDKELIDEADLNWYDYGFRNYDPQIGRFVQLDPLTDDYPELTPYQYCGDEPIANVDQDGAEPEMAAATVKLSAEQAARLAAKHASHSVLHVAGSFFKGVGQSLWGAIKGVATVVAHPVDAAVGIATAVAHPVRTFIAIKTAVKETYHEFKNGDANTRANILGKLTGEILQLAGGEIGELGKVGELGKIARGSEKAGELSKAARVAEEGELLSDVNRAERSVIKEVKPPCGCFLPGTLILTGDGYKPIEKIKPGDIVWAYNDTTQQYGKKKVVRIFEHVRDTVYQVRIGEETINTTSDHPFFVAGRWLRVVNLKVGDSVTTYSGVKVAITAIDLVPKQTKVHNFEVADYHSYYVTKTRVLVHNSGPCDVKFGDLKTHAKKHTEGMDPNLYKERAVKHMTENKSVKFTHNGQTKRAFISKVGEKYRFTSTNMSKRRIFTHMDVEPKYLSNLGIKVPK